jgi:hypothetical protein
MSIRLLARELYQVAKLVEELDQALLDSRLNGPERQRVAEELRLARAERDRLRAILDGAKEGC